MKDRLYSIDLLRGLDMMLLAAIGLFSIGKRIENGKAGGAFWKHVQVRVAMPWVFGMVVRGKA